MKENSQKPTSLITMITYYYVLIFALIKKVPLSISLGTCIKKNKEGRKNIVQGNYNFSFKFPIKYPKGKQIIQILQTALKTKNKSPLNVKVTGKLPQNIMPMEKQSWRPERFIIYWEGNIPQARCVLNVQEGIRQSPQPCSSMRKRQVNRQNVQYYFMIGYLNHSRFFCKQ